MFRYKIKVIKMYPKLILINYKLYKTIIYYIQHYYKFLNNRTVYNGIFFFFFFVRVGPTSKC